MEEGTTKSYQDNTEATVYNLQLLSLDATNEGLQSVTGHFSFLNFSTQVSPHFPFIKMQLY